MLLSAQLPDGGITFGGFSVSISPPKVLTFNFTN